MSTQLGGAVRRRRAADSSLAGGSLWSDTESSVGIIDVDDASLSDLELLREPFWYPNIHVIVVNVADAPNTSRESRATRRQRDAQCELPVDSFNWTLERGDAVPPHF